MATGQGSVAQKRCKSSWGLHRGGTQIVCHGHTAEQCGTKEVHVQLWPAWGGTQIVCHGGDGILCWGAGA
jgi:hypothetical protein